MELLYGRYSKCPKSTIIRCRLGKAADLRKAAMSTNCQLFDRLSVLALEAADSLAAEGNLKRSHRCLRNSLRPLGIQRRFSESRQTNRMVCCRRRLADLFDFERDHCLVLERGFDDLRRSGAAGDANEECPAALMRPIWEKAG